MLTPASVSGGEESGMQRSMPIVEEGWQ